MAPKLSVLLLILAVTTATVLAQRRRPASTSTTNDEWNYRDGCELQDYSLFSALGQNSSSGLIEVMSKLEVKAKLSVNVWLPLCFKQALLADVGR